MSNKPGTFKKGQSGNPGGRKKLPKDIKDSRELNHIEFVRLVNFYMDKPFRVLKDLHEQMDSKTKDMMVISVLYLAVKYGDQKRMEFILNRLIGKVTERVEHQIPTPFVIRRPSGEEVTLAAKMVGEDDVEE